MTRIEIVSQLLAGLLSNSNVKEDLPYVETAEKFADTILANDEAYKKQLRKEGK